MKIRIVAELPAPPPAPLQEGPDDGVAFRQRARHLWTPGRPGGGDPAVAAEHRVQEGVDVDGPAEGMIGEPVRPLDDAVIEGGGVVVRHGGVVGPVVADNGHDARDGEAKRLHEAEEIQHLRLEGLMDDHLAPMIPAVQAQVFHLQQAKAPQHLLRRGRSRHGLVKRHCAVHDHTRRPAFFPHQSSSGHFPAQETDDRKCSRKESRTFSTAPASADTSR